MTTLPFTLPFTLGGSSIVVGTPGSLWWGPWFPDAVGKAEWFGPWFADGKPTAGVIQPPTPGGAATFLLLQSGSKITFSWATDVRKMWSGKEYRAQPLDDPKRTFEGVATLLGDDVRTMRARLARFVANGSTFLLGLPFESISIRADASGVVVPTTTTAKSDWMQVGQRVIVSDGVLNSMSAVVQSFDASSVTLDLAPGSIGRAGGLVMPAIPVFFDPQMTMTRFVGPSNVENWNLNARAAVFGFPSQLRSAFAALSASTGVLAAAYVNAVTPGVVGNALTLAFVGDSFGGVNFTTGDGHAWTCHYTPGVSTVNNVVTAAQLANVFSLSGSYSLTAVLTAGDAITVVLSNGTDSGNGVMGAGATIATYAGRPLWNRGVQVEATAVDELQSLAELVDMGGIPISIGSAKQADWGRALYMKRTSIDEWQWIKAFLAAVRGSQRAFWLASYRADLLPVSFTSAPAVAAAYASASLAASTGGLHTLGIRYGIAGPSGNGYTVQFVGDSTFFSLGGSGTTYQLHFNPGVHTVQNLVDWMGIGGSFVLTGPIVGTALLTSGDNVFVALSGGANAMDPSTALTIVGPSEAAGGLDAWWPTQRDRLRVQQTDGTIVHAQITAVTDNHNNTLTLALATDISMTGAAVALVSWLELVRFDTDEFEFTLDDATFTLQTTARVVQQ